MHQYLVIGAAVAQAGMCQSAPAKQPQPNDAHAAECALVHSVSASVERGKTLPDGYFADDVCHAKPVDLAQLPPDLANAGCTTLGSYQLGLGRTPSRYAICRIATATCSPPGTATRVACNPALNKFLNDHGTALALEYDRAHTLATVCDACLGSELPAGTILVTWHDRANCMEESSVHDLAISQETGVPLSTTKPDPGNCHRSGCLGGCMNPTLPVSL